MTKKKDESKESLSLDLIYKTLFNHMDFIEAQRKINQQQGEVIDSVRKLLTKLTEEVLQLRSHQRNSSEEIKKPLKGTHLSKEKLESKERIVARDVPWQEGDDK